MKTLIFGVAVLFSFAACAQFPYSPLPWKQSDFKTINDKGYTVLKIYTVNDDNKNLATVVEYGKDGLIATISDKGTNDNGDTINKAETSFKFDAKGRLIQQTNIDVESGNGEELTAYTYNAAGKITRKETATIDPPTYNYKYNAAGKLSEVYVTLRMALHEKDGEWHGKTFEKPVDRYVYKYDAKGRLSEEWDFSLMGEKSATPDYKILWSYNDKGQVIKVRRINSEGSEMYTDTYQYNAEGLISTRIFNNGDGPVKYSYEYCKGCKQSWLSAD